MASKSKSSGRPKMGSESRSSAPTGYEIMGKRLEREIMSPKAQRDAHVILTKLEAESWDDWDRFVDEIQTEETLTLREIAPGKVELRWIKFKADSATSYA